MNALLGPKSCMRKGKKWGLVVHTVALFLVTTTSVALSLYTLAVSYINDREFPGGDGIPPGPFGYPDLPKFTVINAVAFAAIQVNQWLVDGLLVSFMLNSATKTFNFSCFSSYIVATLFTAITTGPLPSRL